MLPGEHRMRRAKEFVTAGRGRRAKVGRIVIMLNDRVSHGGPPRVGLSVGRAVGGSVVRHRVARQLRAIVRERTDVLPPGSLAVVKVLPGSEALSFSELTAAVDAALLRLGVPTSSGKPS